MINAELVAVLPKTGKLEALDSEVAADLATELQLIDNQAFKFDEALLAEIQSVIEKTQEGTAGEISLLSVVLPGGKELPLLPDTVELEDSESIILSETVMAIDTRPDSEKPRLDTALLSGGPTTDRAMVVGESDADSEAAVRESKVTELAGEKTNTPTRALNTSIADEIQLRADSSSLKPVEILRQANPQVNSEKNPESLQVSALSNSMKPGPVPIEAGSSLTQKLSIGVPVQHARWADNLAGRVTYMMANNQQSAQISLNPAELGPIEVKVNMHNDQASVNFFAHNAGVRDAIEEAFPRLREMLNENGVTLSQSSVSDQSLSGQREQRQLAGQEQAGYPFAEDKTTPDSVQDSSSSVTVGLVDHFV